MSKRNVFEIVVVCFGLYCAVAFVQYLPALGLRLFTNLDTTPEAATFLYRVLHVLVPLVPLSLAYLFFVHTHRVVTFLDSRTSPPPQSIELNSPFYKLSLWITILGLYYFVSSSAALVSRIPQYFLNWPRRDSLTIVVYHGKEFWMQLFTWLIAVFLIFKSKSIERFIQRRSASDTQPQVGQVSAEAAPSASPAEPST